MTLQDSEALFGAAESIQDVLVLTPGQSDSYVEWTTPVEGASSLPLLLRAYSSSASDTGIPGATAAHQIELFVTYVDGSIAPANPVVTLSWLDAYTGGSLDWAYEEAVFYPAGPVQSITTRITATGIQGPVRFTGVGVSPLPEISTE